MEEIYSDNYKEHRIAVIKVSNGNCIIKIYKNNTAIDYELPINNCDPSIFDSMYAEEIVAPARKHIDGL